MTFDQAYTDNFDWLVNYLRGHGHEAEEIAQAAFCKLYAAWDRYDQSQPLRPYIATIAIRTASNMKRKRWPLVGLDTSTVVAKSEPETLPIDKLPPHLRQVVELIIDGKSQRQISRILGISRYAIKQQLVTAQRLMAA